ncbi:hypothetical protein B0H14DRAFT_3167854 [Mycena olivaceomarginata]|nr:hypothetical protein B0H14DRAFT_3167854 [Mycena olivaceomarginata]
MEDSGCRSAKYWQNGGALNALVDAADDNNPTKDIGATETLEDEVPAPLSPGSVTEPQLSTVMWRKHVLKTAWLKCGYICHVVFRTFYPPPEQYIVLILFPRLFGCQNDCSFYPGGVGGPGGEGYAQGTGGHGGAGQGPTVHLHYDIRTEQFTVNNLYARSAVVQASQIANHWIQHIYVLYGLGGGGKTQIALKFINESSSRTIGTIDTGLKNIAVMKDFGNSRQDGLLWLTSKVEEWLLFLDNADDPSMDLNDFIPQCNHGNIIITSRNPGLCVYAGSHSLVSDMEEEDAVALLLKSAVQETTIGTKKIAAEIIKALHYLPLAIVQAGAFISKSQDLDSYLALYTKNQARLLSEKPTQSHDRYAWTVYTTWQMSFNQLKPAAAIGDLQPCCQYTFPSDGLSKEELQEPLEFLSHFLGPAGEWDSLKFMDVTNEIQAYSLINFDAKKKLFSIHPLVHVWSRATVSEPERYLSTMGSILGMAISERPRLARENLHLASLVLCPHVELAVQMNAEVALVFRRQYVCIFVEVGKIQQTERLLEEVLKKQRLLLGDNHPNTLRTMGNLASTYLTLGKSQKAKELHVIVMEKQKQLLGDNHIDTLLAMGQELKVIVLEKQKQLLGDDHPDTVNTMGNLANTYSDLGEHQRAKDLKLIVLEKQKQLLGDHHPHTVNTMGHLATIYSYLGEHQKAEELKVFVLAKNKQLLGPNHLQTLIAMTNLAQTYSDLREHQKAKELKVVALEKKKQVLGDNHPSILLNMGNLAITYSDLGEHQKAEELYVIVLEKQKQVLGDNHPDTLLTMGVLAKTYSALREHQKAKELKLWCWRNGNSLLGDNHPKTLNMMSNLATTYSDLGEHQKAEKLNVIVLEKQKQLLGDNHPDTLCTMHNLANTYLELKMEKQKQVLGHSHPSTLLSMSGLASTYSNLGEHRKAEELNVTVLEKQKQVLSDNHPHTLVTMSNLANAYLALREHQKAEELIAIVLEKQKQLLGDNHPDTLITMSNLASIYSALRQHQKAEELMVVVLEKQKQVLGDNHPHTLCTMGNLAIIQERLSQEPEIVPSPFLVQIDKPLILVLIDKMADNLEDKIESEID